MVRWFNDVTMKLLITGGSSFLGAHILKRAPHHWQLAATYFSHPIREQNAAAFRVDMREAAAVRDVIRETQPDAIIHTPAAMSGEMLHALNVDGSRNVALAAAVARARLIHISSDVIFDGEHAPYDENAKPEPITPYAESKAQAERVVAESCHNAVIVRTSLIYGFDPMDPRTADILVGKMPRLFTDEFRCPIFVNDLADALIELAAMDYYSLLNIAGPQRLSRYEFGIRLARAFGMQPKFQPALSAASPAPRPRDCTLDVSRAQRILSTRLRGVDEFVQEWKRMKE